MIIFDSISIKPFIKEWDQIFFFRSLFIIFMPKIDIESMAMSYPIFLDIFEASSFFEIPIFPSQVKFECGEGYL